MTLTHCNNALLHKVYHADISLSPINSSCWTSNLLSAMNSLHHARHIQQKIRSADPLDLSQL
eukprot:454599-Pelagomonas_calceolata.AAC.1